MYTVVLVGTGNVASHLYKAIIKTDSMQLVQVAGRNRKRLEDFGNYTTSNVDGLADADVYILAVSDDAIEKVSRSLALNGKLVVHTSGSVSMEALNTHERYGVLYPLQTFSRDREVDFSEIPLCVEAKYDTDLELLLAFASLLSNSVHTIDSDQRKALHMAAVFVNNFTNHLYHIGHSLCDKEDVPFSLLEPLIAETAKKIKELSPFDAQTGPARRGDANTIDSHISRLKDKQHKKIYKLLSQSIAASYGEKL